MQKAQQRISRGELMIHKGLVDLSTKRRWDLHRRTLEKWIALTLALTGNVFVYWLRLYRSLVELHRLVGHPPPQVSDICPRIDHALL